jgi:hypothetical protein
VSEGFALHLPMRQLVVEALKLRGKGVSQRCSVVEGSHDGRGHAHKGHVPVAGVSQGFQIGDLVRNVRENGGIARRLQADEAADDVKLHLGLLMVMVVVIVVKVAVVMMMMMVVVVTVMVMVMVMVVMMVMVAVVVVVVMVMVIKLRRRHQRGHVTNLLKRAPAARQIRLRHVGIANKRQQRAAKRGGMMAWAADIVLGGENGSKKGGGGGGAGMWLEAHGVRTPHLRSEMRRRSWSAAAIA